MRFLEKIKELSKEIKRIKEADQETRLLLGSLLSKNLNENGSLRDAEFKVFSQFGDDGIIQFLIKRLNITADTFVEFGVESYEESNTRFLLMYSNWKGLIIDGSDTNINYIKKDPFFWRYDLTAVSSFITAENINEILLNNGFDGKIGILSIDIDGNDYWVWKAITVAEPDIVIAEYNSLFGVDRAITIPYKSDFYRGSAHHSNLYFGASLPALYDLAKTKGYVFVGCNQGGNNAYFVKEHFSNKINPVSLEAGFISARFREGRNKHGELTHANERVRRSEINGLPVFNTRTGLVETF